MHFHLLIVLCLAEVARASEVAQEVPLMESRGNARIVQVVSTTTEVPEYDLFELTVGVQASYDNPFDPDQIDLSAEITDPAGHTQVVSGFFYQPYTNRNDGDDSRAPLLDAAGVPCWKVRFAPTQLGVYRYQLHLRNSFGGKQADISDEARQFRAVASKSDGFIRVAQPGGRYFRFDSGRPFFPVGQNLQNDWVVYQHSRRLAESGANAARAWMFCHWTWLEWTYQARIPWAEPGHWIRANAGAGRYNQRVAWIADQQMERWTRDGLSVMVCLGNPDGSGELSRGDKETLDRWEGHPYNVANGGFLNDPAQFWTDPRAKKLYKQRLRYIAARWGYCRAIWAWELWNEAGEMTPPIVDWHREMAEYFRSIDPNKHLITTSTWQWAPWKFAAVWDQGGMDFTQSHVYAPLCELQARVGDHLSRWPLPHIVAEGGGPPVAAGLDEAGVREPADPEGIDFHNSLWAPVMIGSAGTTLPWHWRGRIEPKNLFFHYRAIRTFLDGVPWTSERFEPVHVKSIVWAGASPETHYSPVMITPRGSGWGRKVQSDRLTVDPDGSAAGSEEFSKFLFSKQHGDWRNPPRFEVDFPVAGKFLVHVEQTARGILEIYLDGGRVLREESLHVPRREVQRDFAIDVPAGHHEILLDDAGDDWILLGYLLLTNYRDALARPDVEVLGLKSEKRAILWIRHRLNEWAYRAAGVLPEPAGPAAVTLEGFTEGSYRLVWWDTYLGKNTATEVVQARDGLLRLKIPAIRKDAACKLIKLDK